MARPSQSPPSLNRIGRASLTDDQLFSVGPVTNVSSVKREGRRGRKRSPNVEEAPMIVRVADEAEDISKTNERRKKRETMWDLRGRDKGDIEKF